MNSKTEMENSKCQWLWTHPTVIPKLLMQSFIFSAINGREMLALPKRKWYNRRIRQFPKLLFG